MKQTKKMEEMDSVNLTQYGKIHYYENVIADPDYLINLIELSDGGLNENTSIPAWKEWAASGDTEYVFGYQKRFSNNVDTDTHPDIRRINNILKNAIVGSSENYGKMHSMDIGSLMPLSISKYSTGKSMGPHVDDYSNGDNPNISVVLYLNDDYEGGEIYFKEQGVKIKPKAGSIVIFPSVEPYYHESLPVTSGGKYMCPGFWRKTDKVV
jgi:predicted 2-oxoglutarate/Fe(II)-dependent dioxygenase YbiX